HETRGRIGNAEGSRGRILPRGFRLPLRHLEIEFGGELLELPGWDRRGRERVGVYGRGRAAATGRGGAGKGEHAKGRGNNGGERCSFLVRHDVSLSDECREPDRSESRGRSQDVRINLTAMGVSRRKWFTSNGCSCTVGVWETDRMVIHSGSALARDPHGNRPPGRMSVVGHSLPIGAELGESTCLKEPTLIRHGGTPAERKCADIARNP